MPGLIINGVQQIETPTNYRNTIKFLTVPPSCHTKAAFLSTNVATIKALEDPVRREIYDAMRGSAIETFTFATRAIAEQHWQMRISTIEAMNRMTNQGPANRRIDFDYFDNTDPMNLIPVQEPGTMWRFGANARTPFYFRAKPGVVSSAALAQLESGTSRGECLGAIRACFWIGARDALGNAAFNTMHPAGSLNLGVSDHRRNAIDPSVIIPGDYLYMTNIADYGILTNGKGFWNGENCVYMGKVMNVAKYSGLGLPLLTAAQLRGKLKAAYTRETKVPVTAARANREIIFNSVRRPSLAR